MKVRPEFQALVEEPEDYSGRKQELRQQLEGLNNPQAQGVSTADAFATILGIGTQIGLGLALGGKKKGLRGAAAGLGEYGKALTEKSKTDAILGERKRSSQAKALYGELDDINKREYEESKAAKELKKDIIFKEQDVLDKEKFADKDYARREALARLKARNSTTRSTFELIREEQGNEAAQSYLSQVAQGTRGGGLDSMILSQMLNNLSDEAKQEAINTMGEGLIRKKSFLSDPNRATTEKESIAMVTGLRTVYGDKAPDLANMPDTYFAGKPKGIVEKEASDLARKLQDTVDPKFTGMLIEQLNGGSPDFSSVPGLTERQTAQIIANEKFNQRMGLDKQRLTNDIEKTEITADEAERYWDVFTSLSKGENDPFLAGITKPEDLVGMDKDLARWKVRTMTEKRAGEYTPEQLANIEPYLLGEKVDLDKLPYDLIDKTSVQKRVESIKQARIRERNDRANLISEEGSVAIVEGHNKRVPEEYRIKNAKALAGVSPAVAKAYLSVNSPEEVSRTIQASSFKQQQQAFDEARRFQLTGAFSHAYLKKSAPIPKDERIDKVRDADRAYDAMSSAYREIISQYGNIGTFHLDWGKLRGDSAESAQRVKAAGQQLMKATVALLQLESEKTLTTPSAAVAAARKVVPDVDPSSLGRLLKFENVAKGELDAVLKLNAKAFENIVSKEGFGVGAGGSNAKSMQDIYDVHIPIVSRDSGAVPAFNKAWRELEGQMETRSGVSRKDRFERYRNMGNGG